MAIRPELELAWFAAALDDLADFLLSTDSFRRLSQPPHRAAPDLSLGGMLLAGDTLQASEGDLSSPQRSLWAQLRARWEAEQGRHAAAIERKAAAELPLRYNLWRAYLSDLGTDPQEARNYAAEVRNRVTIDRLTDILGRQGAAKVPVEHVDETLRRWFAPGEFVWPEAMGVVYPRGRYWYLYGRPGGPSRHT
jgi:hypothetical protein